MIYKHMFSACRTKFFIFILLVVLPCYAYGIEAEQSRKLQVVTTLFPLYDFSRAIGKDKIKLRLLLPPGVEAHAFEPGPSDSVATYNADIFIYTGQEMEPWVTDFLSGVNNKRILIIDTSKGITAETHKGRKHNDYNRSDHKTDPHIWLNPLNAQVMVEHIASGFIQKDSSNKVFYQKNAAEYKQKLAELDKQIQTALSNCKYRTLIYAGHVAFGYFADRYNLDFVSPYKGFSPNAEPGPKSIAELIKKVRSLGVSYIYHEELVEPKIAKVIAEETRAELLVLHGVHNVSKEDFEKGVTYLSIMYNNLKNLKKGLQCQ